MIIINGLVPNTLVNNYFRHTNLKVFRKGISITDIFRDYWDSFLVVHKHLNIRPVVFENVDKILKCRTPELGYSSYECPNCDNFHIAFNTCKSRFCNSCGIKYSESRSVSASNMMLDVSHRHITFTIPDSLRDHFRKKRSRLNLLFEAVNMTLKYLLSKHGKYKKYQAGYILVLHTFGRALNFNPHIHCLISEKMIDALGHSKSLKYFNFTLLRRSFMKCLLDLLHQDIGPSFYKEKVTLYDTLEHGFYVHAPLSTSKFKSQKELIKYVLRYTGRPVMASSRIKDLDKNDFITYFYEPHEDDHLPESEQTGPLDVHEHVYDFIKKLIIHIPDLQFKTVRYYGLYASKSKSLVSKEKRISSFLKPRRWRYLLFDSFKYDVLKCQCGFIMKYIRESSYFP